MNTAEQDFAKSLIRIFDNVLLTEEVALSKGYFADLSIAELHTLDAIGPYEERTMGETASILGITVGTLSVATDRLVKKGYLVRRRDEKDRRVVRIALTHKGKLAYRMHGKFHTLLVRRIMEPLDEDKQVLLAKMVRDIDEFIYEQYQKYEQQMAEKDEERNGSNDVG